MRLPKGDHLLYEFKCILVVLHQIPVQPAHLIILAVDVVVSELGIQEFVSRQKHGNAAAEEKERKGILRLPLSQMKDLRIIRRTFDAAVPAAVVIGTVPVILSVHLIMLFIIGHQIIQREAVMTGDKIHRRI